MGLTDDQIFDLGLDLSTNNFVSTEMEILVGLLINWRPLMLHLHFCLWL
jgi:hypothetical protein